MAKRIAADLAILAGLSIVGSLSNAGLAAVPDRIQPAVRPFDLRLVRLLDGPCKDALEANRKYLHDLDADRLLHAFRLNAKLDAPGQPLGGWEKPDCEVRGHFVGHYLSACALMCRATGDEKLKAKTGSMVTELAKCQKALGGGYLSAFPASFFDRWEAMQQVWAPYYTIHKIMAGLYDQYTLCGNQQALDVLKDMASWFKKRTDRFSHADMDRMMDRNEEGGMAEVLWDLYSVTGDPDHRTLAERFDERPFLDRLARGEDCLAGRHGNTHIPLAVGAARKYELTGEARCRYMAEYFWDRVVNTRSFATGGSTNGEIWGPPYTLAGTLSNTNHETCKTYNMLRLTRHLFQWTADPVYADFYERAFLNGILGTQEPRTGMLEYYVPQATGFKRVYGTPTDTFWCCYGTGIETFAKLADSIYFHDDNSLYVNLFIPSELNWPEKRLRITQTTAFPQASRTRLVIHADKPTAFALKLRAPWWISDKAYAGLNGTALTVEAMPSSFLTVHREWKDGDVIEITLPMRLHTWPMPDDSNLVAFMYGPVVLAGLIDPNEPDEPIHSANAVEPQPEIERLPRYYFLADSPHDVSWLKPVEGKPLTFRTTGQPFDITFVPFHRIIGRRYGLHWPVLPAGSDRHLGMERQNRDQQARLQRLVDEVRPGNEQSEKLHGLKMKDSAAGSHMGKQWRHAGPGGWWSWELKVVSDTPLVLSCTYWGNDVPPRTFDILVDGQKLATQSLNRNKPGEFFNVEYPLPPESIRGKEKITVRFQPHDGNTAGGVFGCAILR